MARLRWAPLGAFLLAIGAALAAGAASGPTANLEAERFAQNLIDEGLAILRDDTADAQARRRRFSAFILPHIEARNTALFTLGIYRRGVSQRALDEFVEAFRDYTVAIYEVRLDEYRHATLKVLGSIESKPGDVIVNTRGEDRRLREAVAIGFRLNVADTTFKIVDVEVAGIWLSVEQREQFISFLGQRGGDVAALTVELKARTGRIRAGARST